MSYRDSAFVRLRMEEIEREILARGRRERLLESVHVSARRSWIRSASAAAIRSAGRGVLAFAEWIDACTTEADPQQRQEIATH
jgi:hypothetical protein